MGYGKKRSFSEKVMLLELLILAAMRRKTIYLFLILDYILNFFYFLLSISVLLFISFLRFLFLNSLFFVNCLLILIFNKITTKIIKTYVLIVA